MAAPLWSSETESAVAKFVAWEGITAKTARSFDLPKSGTSTKTVTYQLQNSVDDGFIRLYTMAGHRYWIAQAENQHKTPDWKLHISVAPEDLGTAWNHISMLFVLFQCSAAMKIVNGYTKPPTFMRGREITIYIYRHSKTYDAAMFYEEDKRLPLSKELEEGCNFWLHFIAAADRSLEDAGLLPGPLAAGDRQVGRYCSIRNESFVQIPPGISRGLSEEEMDFYRSFRSGAKDGSTYPPNAMGYNARGHRDPLQAPRNPISCVLFATTTLALLTLLLACRMW